MANYITYDYRCADCEETFIKMVERSNIPEIVECSCGGSAGRILSANIARVSYPDGTTDRFKYIKEKRKLDKLERAAKRKGNREEQQRIAAEQTAVRQASAKDKQAANICKVSQRDE